MISHRDRASQGVKDRGTRNIDTPEEQEAEEVAQKRDRGSATKKYTDTPVGNRSISSPEPDPDAALL